AVGSAVAAWLDLPRWISNHQMIVGVAPEGERSDRVAGFQIAREQAEIAWKKGFGGREPSISVLDSGIPQSLPQGKLMLLDVSTGRKTAVLAGNFSRASVSSSGSYVAGSRQL